MESPDTPDPAPIPDPDETPAGVPCLECDGTGYTEIDGPCPDCDGTGWLGA